MIILGMMRPRLIAKMMARAVVPSAIVALNSSSVVCEPSASCTRPLAILNRNTPGIIETTEANPMAAKGMWQRRATGVRISADDETSHQGADRRAGAKRLQATTT